MQRVARPSMLSHVQEKSSLKWLRFVAPGLLVAATGVGAGDLATAGLTGSKLGYAVLWAVVLGAFVKYVLNEGLARWQIANSQTLLEGACLRLGPIVHVVFLAYLLPWTFFVGAALMSACGVTTNAMLPFPWAIGPIDVPMIGDDLLATPAASGRFVYGVLHSLIGLTLVFIGGYRVFEKVMAACIAVMFFSVVITALMIGADWSGVARGLLVPTIPQQPGAFAWTVSVMGGVGGTLTVLSYGYWIREARRDSANDLHACRIDLAVGYAFTALFGVALMVIARGIELDGQGATLIARLGDRIGLATGEAGRWVFLIGAWCAVASSLLGVWQSVPYIFADFVMLLQRRGAVPRETSRPYRVYLVLIAIVPILGLVRSFEHAQKFYAIFGACFIPLLALTILILNNRRDWIGDRLRNRWTSNLVLLTALALSALAAAYAILEEL